MLAPLYIQLGILSENFPSDLAFGSDEQHFFAVDINCIDFNDAVFHPDLAVEGRGRVKPWIDHKDARITNDIEEPIGDNLVVLADLEASVYGLFLQGWIVSLERKLQSIDVSVGLSNNEKVRVAHFKVVSDVESWNYVEQDGNELLVDVEHHYACLGLQKHNLVVETRNSNINRRKVVHSKELHNLAIHHHSGPGLTHCVIGVVYIV